MFTRKSMTFALTELTGKSSPPTLLLSVESVVAPFHRISYTDAVAILQAKIKVEESTLTRHDVFIADECFLTGTAAEVIAVVKCDGRPIGNGKPGPLTKQLREAFQKLVRQ